MCTSMCDRERERVTMIACILHLPTYTNTVQREQATKFLCLSSCATWPEMHTVCNCALRNYILCTFLFIDDLVCSSAIHCTMHFAS